MTTWGWVGILSGLRSSIERIRKKYEQFDWPYVAAWQEFKAKSQKR